MCHSAAQWPTMVFYLHSARTRSLSATNEPKVSLLSSWTSEAIASVAAPSKPRAALRMLFIFYDVTY